MSEPSWTVDGCQRTRGAGSCAVRDTPLTAAIEERWASGEPGGRPRRVLWTFDWDAGPTRENVYDIEHNDDAANYTADARRRTDVMVAKLVG